VASESSSLAPRRLQLDRCRLESPWRAPVGAREDGPTRSLRSLRGLRLPWSRSLAPLAHETLAALLTRSLRSLVVVLVPLDSLRSSSDVRLGRFAPSAHRRPPSRSAPAPFSPARAGFPAASATLAFRRRPRCGVSNCLSLADSPMGESRRTNRRAKAGRVPGRVGMEGAGARVAAKPPRNEEAGEAGLPEGEARRSKHRSGVSEANGARSAASRASRPRQGLPASNSAVAVGTV
jgi:hypothetical protein